MTKWTVSLTPYITREWYHYMLILGEQLAFYNWTGTSFGREKAKGNGGRWSDHSTGHGLFLRRRPQPQPGPPKGKEAVVLATLFGSAPCCRPAHRPLRLWSAGLRLVHLSFTLEDVRSRETLEVAFEFVARRVREVEKGAGRLPGAPNPVVSDPGGRKVKRADEVRGR